MGIPDPSLLLVGALAFFRIGGIIYALPIFGDSPTPIQARALLTFALTICMLPVIPASWAPAMPTETFALAVLLISELLIGLTIGFIARAAFAGILMAASIVAYQMGFGTANLFMPDAGAQMDGFTAFHRVLIMLIFLTLGMHYLFLDAIAESFELIPGGGLTLNGIIGETLIEVTAGVFTIALQLAAPVLVALLFTMAALGLIARTVPQMNVFVLSFPISFFIGLLVYLATFPLFPGWTRAHFTSVHEVMIGVTHAMGL